MKKIVFILVTLCFPIFNYGQVVVGGDGWSMSEDYIWTTDYDRYKHVGIGTEKPAGTLHVVGDLVLGTNQWNKRFIFHSRSDLNTKGDFLQITNDTSEGMWDWSQGIIIHRGGNVIIGNPKTEHSAKLTIDGNVKINGGSPGMGKVLTSDANGLASWQQPANAPPTLAIGDTYAGGIIFYLDETAQHGLVVTTTDIGTDISWSNNESTVTNATSFGIYGGSINTMLIIAQETIDDPSGTFAAQVCVTGQTNDAYGNWYLPSYQEWVLLDTAENKIHTGILDDTYYWCSTEVNEDQAYMRWTGFGNEGGWDWADKSTPNKVRAIRKF